MKDRVRISLTLRPEILELLDSKIDGTKIRNRSHAVEQFLRQSLIGSTSQAVILVGDEEKSLKDICGETVIEKMLSRLEKASIFKIIICCNNTSQKLQKFLAKKQFSKFTFVYANNENKGTAATLFACKEKLDPTPFLFIYGDIFAEVDIYDLIDLHETHNGQATMVVTSVADPLPWGVVKVKRNRITDFYEKPTEGNIPSMRITNLINAGIYIFDHEIFSYFSKETKNIETDLVPQLIKERQIYSYLLDGAWFNISRENLLTHAQKYCTPKNLKKKV